MPIKVAQNLQGICELEKEGIFAMEAGRAESQDIRPLRLAILNLMPNKEVTEKQLLRLIANSPLQVEVVFLRTGSYESKNTNSDYLTNFYKTFDDIIKQNQKFDGLIITGAPVERMAFASVEYWEELSSIFKWAEKNVYSSLYICWAAQAAMYYHYGVHKKEVSKKIFGLFNHKVLMPQNPILRGFDSEFIAPHSRHTDVAIDDCKKFVDILATSSDAGLYLAASTDLRKVFIFGHGEYDNDTLHLEYIRDKQKGIKQDKPKNYYIKNKEGVVPPITWRAHQSLLFSNWINYCVYQRTPFNLTNYLEEKNNLKATLT